MKFSYFLCFPVKILYISYEIPTFQGAPQGQGHNYVIQYITSITITFIVT